ncbi:MAG: SurA N-terminal domain-containing protein [Chitinophagaceae bacterium]|nr:SurA N-terminal domain-containing protein [Chitinophagaceae bacterium]
MSVIQTIRDRGGLISAIIIAIALLGFILMDAFSSRSNLFGGNTTTVGTINGKDIDYRAYQNAVKAQEDYYQQQNQPVNDNMRQQINESVWNDEISKVVMDKEFNELGITVGKNELNDILFGKNPPPDLKQGFTDPKTNMYNAEQARQYFTQMKRSKIAADRQRLNNYVTSVERNRMNEKYISLLTNSVNIPKWFVEKQNIENSQSARVSFVKVPYTTIPDSAAKVSDAEIEAYISKHKDEYKQETETRNVEYVLFNAGPNAADSNEVRQKLEALKPEFAAATDISAFVAKSGSESPYYDGYLSKNGIKQPNKDSILAQPIGVVYGPYLDAGSYGLSRVMGVKQWADTVKVRHILIATQQQNQQGQMVPVLDDSTAKKKIDSIETAIRNGANFDTLCAKFSDDPGSKDKGGVYDNVYVGQMVPPFNNFIFDNKPGAKGVVKTDFGYHYIEVLSAKGSSPAYKVAYITKPIYPSSSTDDSVSNAAGKFAGESADTKAFIANFDKELRPKGLMKLVASDIKPNDYSISQGLEASRQLVKAIFEAKKGAVLQPYRIGESYVVVTVTDINKAGTQSVSKARPVVEAILSKQKKAQQIAQKIGKVSTLEAVASAMNQPVLTDSSLRVTGGGLIGFEPRVTGAAFNPANKGKVVAEPIEGREGVFAIKVDDVSATAVENANIDQQRKQLAANLRQRMSYPQQVLIKTANVKDNRSKFF